MLVLFYFVFEKNGRKEKKPAKTHVGFVLFRFLIQFRLVKSK